jgi:hypothetical protein
MLHENSSLAGQQKLQIGKFTHSFNEIIRLDVFADVSSNELELQALPSTPN